MKKEKVGIALLLLLISMQFIPMTSAPPGPITLSNVELVTVSEDYAAVTWVTNIQSDTTVEWGTTEQLGQESTVSESVNYHMGEIEDLAQGTKYYYRVGSGGTYSDISSFTTLTDPGGDFEIEFAVVADSHYDVDGTNSANGNMNEDSVRLLSSTVDELNEIDTLDFVVTLGDLTNGAESDYSGVVDTMDNLDVPWYPLLGNWEKDDPNWETYYSTYMKKTDTYYSIDYGSYHIVILDSAVEGQINGNLDETQLTWLESDLDANMGVPTLIFMHHMADRTDDIFGIESDAQSRLVTILSARPQVLSVYSGHIHQNIKSTVAGIPNIAVASTVQYPIGYSIIRLYKEGYTQAFYKVQSELEISEESRLRIKSSSGDTDADSEYLGSLEERSMVVHIPGNDPPSISSISQLPPTVHPKESVTITVTASDPDGDTLIYHYECSAGTILGSGSEVSWEAPDETGEVTLTVWVSDGIKNSNKWLTTIEVIEKPSKGDDGGVPGFETAFILISLVICGIYGSFRRKRYQ
jgi:hypothetical protein